MIRYNYNQQVTPPAPFVHVTVRSAANAPTATELLPAQIDCAADSTVVPLSVVEALDLDPLDQVSILGFGGHISNVYTFLVNLSIRDLEPVVLKVVASEEEPYVLLGRDVLNRYRMVLDGPGLVLEIS